MLQDTMELHVKSRRNISQLAPTLNHDHILVIVEIIKAGSGFYSLDGDHKHLI